MTAPLELNTNVVSKASSVQLTPTVNVAPAVRGSLERLVTLSEPGSGGKNVLITVTEVVVPVLIVTTGGVALKEPLFTL